MIKPVRMRPEHPLPEPISSVSAHQAPMNGKAVDKKLKKRVKAPPTRARRRTIDPTKWGSVHLKGVFLEGSNEISAAHRSPDAVQVSVDSPDSEDSDSEDEEERQGDIKIDEPEVHVPLIPAPIHASTSGAVETAARLVPSAQTTSKATPSSVTDLAEEAKVSLGLLHSLFEGKDDWVGEESLDSDVEMNAQADTRMFEASTEQEDGIEEVSIEAEAQVTLSRTNSPLSDVPGEHNDPSPSALPTSKPTKLKELFAPTSDSGMCVHKRCDIKD